LVGASIQKEALSDESVPLMVIPPVVLEEAVSLEDTGPNEAIPLGNLLVVASPRGGK
jgi:hypothetical protein